MLKEIGVDSIKELRHRNAARLKEMIDSRHGKVIGVSEQTCQDWIERQRHTRRRDGLSIGTYEALLVRAGFPGLAIRTESRA